MLAVPLPGIALETSLFRKVLSVTNTAVMAIQFTGMTESVSQMVFIEPNSRGTTWYMVYLLIWKPPKKIESHECDSLDHQGASIVLLWRLG
jgi:hypothetical protein